MTCLLASLRCSRIFCFPARWLNPLRGSSQSGLSSFLLHLSAQHARTAGRQDPQSAVGAGPSAGQGRHWYVMFELLLSWILPSAFRELLCSALLMCFGALPRSELDGCFTCRRC